MDRELEREIADIVGDDHVLTSPELTGGYSVDWTGRFHGEPAAVVRPSSAGEVAAVLRVLSREGIAVVPQGGNTSLVGGSVPLRGEAVLSLARMRTLGPIVDRQVTAEAGVTLDQIDVAAAPHALRYGVRLASGESATVGGTLSTNAGGLNVIRYGDTAAQVLGVEAVLADGTVVEHLSGLTKDNTGYRWHQLLVGAEGTLGVITKARLRLVPLYDKRCVALVGVDSLDVAVELASTLREHAPGVEAVEMMLPEGMELLVTHMGMTAPFSRSMGAYVLVEVVDWVDPTEVLAGLLAPYEHVLVGTARRDRQRLWEYRERHPEVIGRFGVPHKLDVTVPLSAYVQFAAAVEKLVQNLAPSAALVRFGHIADGNIHVNIANVPPEVSVETAIFELVNSFGGSISAEHGIGVAKKQWLHLARSPEEIAMWRRLKAALDPHGILNPNVLFAP